LCRFQERADHALEPPTPPPHSPKHPLLFLRNVTLFVGRWWRAKGGHHYFKIYIKMKHYNGKETFKGIVSRDEYCFKDPKI
jgi:hypothetical protein